MALKAIAVVGPTASGKTRRAVEIAQKFGGEIISADSRQIYTGMTIGTGKDLVEYKDVPYHLIDIAPAGTKYNLYQYLKDFRTIYESLRNRDIRAVICGGSGMYVENALRGIVMPEVPCNTELRKFYANKSLDELTGILKQYKTLHNKTDVDSVARAIRAIEIEEFYIKHPDLAELADKSLAKPIDALIIGVDISREDRRKRISKRLADRMEEGMIEEVKSLIDSGITPTDLIYYGLEYKFVTLYITGVLKYDEMLAGLETAIHQFAKRQMTWFRGMEKRGLHINWIPYDIQTAEFLNRVEELLNQTVKNII